MFSLVSPLLPGLLSLKNKTPTEEKDFRTLVTLIGN